MSAVVHWFLYETVSLILGNSCWHFVVVLKHSLMKTSFTETLLPFDSCFTASPAQIQESVRIRSQEYLTSPSHYVKISWLIYSVLAPSILLLCVDNSFIGLIHLIHPFVLFIVTPFSYRCYLKQPIHLPFLSTFPSPTSILVTIVISKCSKLFCFLSYILHESFFMFLSSITRY